MKDILEFPVVGVKYSHLSPGFLNAIQIGAVVFLKPEPDNRFDQYAIQVVIDGTPIGYVPNKGYTCTNCWTRWDPEYSYCVKCNSGEELVAKGGLAFRLIGSKAMKTDLVGFISQINPEAEFDRFLVRVIIE